MTRCDDTLAPSVKKTDPFSELQALNRSRSGEIMQPGTLYLVGTPIGNLGDLSTRAAAILGEADLVVAEDTRRTLRLLNYLGIRKHLESYHEHNKRDKEPLLLQRLQSGTRLALVTDAGMPGISDPGSDLVSACVREGIPVVVIPGPCAAITALAGSGLPTDRFVFEGFLPVSGKARKVRLAGLADEPRITILYEAPHRIKRTLTDLAAVPELAGRRLTLGRELTKAHEEYIRSTIGEAAGMYQQTEPRGEYVLVLEGMTAWSERIQTGESDASMIDDKHALQADAKLDRASGQTADPAVDPAVAILHDLLKEGKSLKDAVRQCARKTGRGRNELYPLALELVSDAAAGTDPDAAAGKSPAPVEPVEPSRLP